MKGFVFAELVDYAASAFPSTLDAELRGLRYDGAVAYPHGELLELAGRLSQATGVPREDLLRRFGNHLFGRFVAIYPVFFFDIDSAFTFLGQINGYVHDEVRKLHPDAQFPHFDCVRHGPRELEMVYRSSRPFADLAEGLIRGCIAYFDEPIDLTRTDLERADGTVARFLLRGEGATGS